MVLVPGARIGSDEVLDLLGEGGMGQVYRARDHTLGRDVALKILSAIVADDADRLARFRGEAQVLASLNRPNIAQIIAHVRSAELQLGDHRVKRRDDDRRRRNLDRAKHGDRPASVRGAGPAAVR